MDRHLAQIDLIEGALKVLEAEIAREAMTDPVIRRLLTLPGVDMTVATGVAAAIGDIRRFPDPGKLIGYLGLNPSVRQSGEGPAYHGRISKQGRGRARGCWWRPPGPPRGLLAPSAPSISGSPRAVAGTSPPSPPPGSWR